MEDSTAIEDRVLWEDLCIVCECNSAEESLFERNIASKLPFHYCGFYYRSMQHRDSQHMHDNHHRPAWLEHQSNPSLCCTPRDRARRLDQCHCDWHHANDRMDNRQRICLLDARNKCRNRLGPFWIVNIRVPFRINTPAHDTSCSVRDNDDIRSRSCTRHIFCSNYKFIHRYWLVFLHLLPILHITRIDTCAIVWRRRIVQTKISASVTVLS